MHPWPQRASTQESRRGFPIDHIFWPKKSGGGHNRAVPAFGYVGRVYGVAGAPNHAKQQLAAGLSEATGLAKLLRIAGLYTVLDCLRHFAVP
jgi:hypothetical protein